MIEIFGLLIAFQVKHLIADYYLQFPFMYENKGKEKGWFEPLLAHALVHGIGTSIIIGTFLLFQPFSVGILMIYWGVILLDIVSHFIIDRWKATRKGGPDTKSFWTNLGIDQGLHHIIGIMIIFLIIGV